MKIRAMKKRALKNASNLRISGISLLWVLLSTLVVWPTWANDNSARGERTLTWEQAADGIDRLELDGGNGSVEIVASDSETIEVELRVRFDRWPRNAGRGALGWFLRSDYPDGDALVEAVKIEAEHSDNTLEIGVRPRGKSREALVEDWRIRVPRRLALELDLASASVDVTGVEAGVQLRMGHGDAKIEVPRGPLDLRVTVGKIDARVREADVGYVSLRSQVGDTRLWLDGNRVRYTDPPGPGSEVVIEGDGPDDIDVRVRVGDAKLRVN